jgi:hypothetical protein
MASARPALEQVRALVTGAADEGGPGQCTTSEREMKGEMN